MNLFVCQCGVGAVAIISGHPWDSSEAIVGGICRHNSRTFSPFFHLFHLPVFLVSASLPRISNDSLKLEDASRFPEISLFFPLFPSLSLSLFFNLLPPSVFSSSVSFLPNFYPSLCCARPFASTGGYQSMPPQHPSRYGYSSFSFGPSLLRPPSHLTHVWLAFWPAPGSLYPSFNPPSFH